MDVMVREEIAQVVWHHFMDNSLIDHFPEIYIFGSLINRNGRHFLPSGVSGSDVDLLIVFNPDLNCAEGRLSALKCVRENVHLLEQADGAVLSRTEKVFSILPVTDYEVYHCIHKGFDPKIFTMNIFYNIMEGKMEEDGLTDYIDFDYHLENIEPFTAIRMAQKIRNEYISIDMIQRESEKLVQFDEIEEVPKEIMRACALIHFHASDDENIELRTDLEEGFNFLRRQMDRCAGERREIVELRDLIAGRAFSRAKAAPISVDQIVLLAEFVHDLARANIRKSIREVIDQSGL